MDQRRRYQAKLAAVDAELKVAIQTAFADGLTAKPIAEAAGLSPERIYQLRNGRH
jgi:hypothetical protein